jgi:hypothetical protein
MENVQMLFPMEPNEFWSHLKTITEKVVNQKNSSISKSSSAENHTTSIGLIQTFQLKTLQVQ